MRGEHVRRLAFERCSGADDLPDGIELIGRYYSREATFLPRHVHENAFEICYIHQGVMRYRLDDRQADIGPGEVHLCRPGEWHAGINNRLEPCLLYWFEVIPERLLNSGDCLEFFKGNPVGKFFLGGEWFRDATEEILAEYIDKPVDWQASMHHLVCRLLIRLYRVWKEGKKDLAVPSYSAPVRQVINAMLGHVRNSATLPELLEAGGLCRSTIHERFRRETGYSPNDYWLRLRVDLAAEMLLDRNFSITEVAYRLNFSSSQYFSTVFKKITGYSPHYWRRHFQYRMK